MRGARGRLACSAFQGDKANQYQFKAASIIIFSRFFHLLATNIYIHQHTPVTKVSIKRLCEDGSLIRIQKTPASNLGSPAYTDEVFGPSTPSVKTFVKQATTASFHVLCMVTSEWQSKHYFEKQKNTRNRQDNATGSQTST
jgi:hypothetical protein